jgi:hypothetical protein
MDGKAMIAIRFCATYGATTKSLMYVVFLANLIGLICSLPVSAESSLAAAPPAKTSTTPQETAPSPDKNTGSAFGHLPKRLVAFTVGATFGTPLALIRCTKREVISQTKVAYTLGDAPKPLHYLTAVFFGVPSGVMYGAFWGTANGVADSWVNSDDTAFSKSSFSLEKLTF